MTHTCTDPDSSARNCQACYGGDCPAGGEHEWELHDTGDSGQRPYVWWACSNCGAPRRPPQVDNAMLTHPNDDPR